MSLPAEASFRYRGKFRILKGGNNRTVSDPVTLDQDGLDGDPVQALWRIENETRSTRS